MEKPSNKKEVLKLLDEIKNKIQIIEAMIDDKKIIVGNTILDSSGLRTEPCTKKECPSQEIWCDGKKIQ